MNILQRMLDMPAMGKLNLFAMAGLWSMFKAGILTRSGVGVTRMVADYPAFNPKDTMTPQQKERAFLERVFTETVGTFALTYGVLYLGMDLAAKLLQSLDRSLAPQQLLNAVKAKLQGDQELDHFKAALAQVLPGVKEDFNRTHNVIYDRIFGNGHIAGLAKALNRPEWLAVDQATGHATGLLKDEVNGYFRHLNGRSVAVMAVATGLSAWLSGGPLQAWNDGWFREHVTFKLLNAYDNWKGRHPIARVDTRTPVLLAASQPLANMRGTTPSSGSNAFGPNSATATNNPAPWPKAPLGNTPAVAPALSSPVMASASFTAAPVLTRPNPAFYDTPSPFPSAAVMPASRPLAALSLR